MEELLFNETEDCLQLLKLDKKNCNIRWMHSKVPWALMQVDIITSTADDDFKEIQGVLFSLF